MKNLRLIPVILFLSIITGLNAQTIKLDDPIPPDPNIKIGTLDNGLT